MERKREVGERVVVAIRRQEYAATVATAGKVGYIVKVDEGEEIFRHPFEVYDIFSDGRQP